MTRCSLLIAITLPWLATSCLDSLKKKEPASSSPMSKSLESRILSRDPNRRSSFEKSMPSSLQPDSNSTSGLMSKLFGTKQSKQGKPLAGVREFQFKKETSMGIGSNRMAAQSAREGSQVAPGMTQTFSTESNRLANQGNRMANEGFRESGDSFGTFSNFDGARAIKKNTKPNIVKKADGTKEAAYGEEQVRSLLNRN